MNAIVGMTRIGRNASDTDKKNYAFDKITMASSHLLGVINDILDVSKIEAGKFELSPKEFRFENMMQCVININSYRSEEKEQALTVDIDGNIPKILLGDEQRLAQVITNLLANAVKFTPERGTIAVSARLDGERDGVCTVRIDVTDSGIGISPEQQAKLFRSFQQAEGDTSLKFGGTGLGLSISKSIVEMMNGTIWIESELGKGATFSFTVEAERREETVEAETPDTDCLDVRFEGRRLLLADDIEINREIVQAILEPTLIDIECAKDGKQAVEMWAAAPHTYDLILMDVLMPDMDGYEATRAIRASNAPEGKTVPIVAMTANVFREDVESSMNAGMNAHIGKPIDFNEMMDVLKKYLG
jgi:CheY-like chemotaxis protein/two-component sensor histidine kinase